MKSCSKIARKGKSCLKLLKPKKVAPNAKSCSKVAEHNRDMPINECFHDFMLVNRAQTPPPPPPPFGKFSSTARCKALQSLYCTIRRLFVLFVDYSRTIRALFVLFADYSHYSSTIRGLFVLFVDYSHYSLHYSCFINCT